MNIFKNKVMLHFITLASCIWGCKNECSDDLEVGLYLAGENRTELGNVLEHFQQDSKDSLKYKAACFLIANMRWHKNYEKADGWKCDLQHHLFQLDSICCQMSLLDDVYSKQYLELSKEKDVLRRELQNIQIEPKFFRQYAISDLKSVKADFLISHIERAVDRWLKSPYGKILTFNEFCEYILPYKAMPDGWNINGGIIEDLFAKQLVDIDSCLDLQEIVKRYNRYMNILRETVGDPCPKRSLGWQDIFFNRQRDCVDQCEFETQVMRACGIPASMAICVSNREFVGMHHYCILIDTSKNRQVVNAESNYLGRKYWGYSLNYRLNAFEYRYGVQKDSPYMLRGKGEALPENFTSPVIKEVTPDIRTTVSLSLKIPHNVKNNLIWLYTYSREKGSIAVTWGIVDKEKGEAFFRYVIPGVVYFPAYLDNKEVPCFFGNPLFVEKDGKEGRWLDVNELLENGQKEDVVLTRKFPRKPSMVRLADELIGSKFYGANKSDFSDKQELYRINERPGDYLNEYPLKPRAFRYYIFEPVSGYSEVSVLEFLADSSRCYSNVTAPLPQQIFTPTDTLKNRKTWMSLLPETQNDSQEFDGNVQTVSGSKQVVLKLKERQIVDCIRLIPKNADNIIYPHEVYELFYWEKGWKSYAKVKSRYNYLEFKQLPTDKLYWLKNYSRGKEEVPFVIINGQQKFLYYDIFTSPLDL